MSAFDAIYSAIWVPTNIATWTTIRDDTRKVINTATHDAIRAATWSASDTSTWDTTRDAMEDLS